MRRSAVVVLALLLAAAAAWLWFGGSGSTDAHESFDARDQEALESLLREDGER